MPSVVLVSDPALTTEFGETNHLISLHCAKKNMCISDRIWQCNGNLCPPKKRRRVCTGPSQHSGRRLYRIKHGVLLWFQRPWHSSDHPKHTCARTSHWGHTWLFCHHHHRPEWQERMGKDGKQKPKTRKQWGKKHHLHFIANVHFDNAWLIQIQTTNISHVANWVDMLFLSHRKSTVLENMCSSFDTPFIG